MLLNASRRHRPTLMTGGWVQEIRETELADTTTGGQRLWGEGGGHKRWQTDEQVESHT